MKLKEGWVKSKLWFEILAGSKETAEKSLKEHVKKIETIDGVEILDKKFEETIEVKKLPEKFKLMKLKKAFSKVVEVTLVTDSVEKLLLVVMLFGPSGVEILEPKEFKLSLATVQTIMNSVADMMHRFAASSVGGVMIKA